MKNLIWILLMSCTLFLGACAGEDRNKAGDSNVNQQSLVKGSKTKNDKNPIPPQWRPMFNHVANGEIDSMFPLFTDGMHFMINEQPANSPTEARNMLRTFYRENKPTSFRYLHNGESKSGLAQYAIGELDTDNSTYRVTMVMQNSQLISLEYELP
jgi:hypothetical protein